MQKTSAAGIRSAAPDKALYGEEFDLVSNPAPDGTGYAVEGISRKFGGLRHLRLPLSVMQTIEHELFMMEGTEVAA